MYKNKNVGFTLLEMLLTISIVAILASAASIFMGDIIDKKRLENAAYQISTDLRLAQSEAIKQNKKIYVSFNYNSDNWCYGLNENQKCDCLTDKLCRISGLQKIKTNETFKNVTLQKAQFAGKKSYTAFDPVKGFPIADGLKNGSIWLKSENELQMAIVINRLGRIRLCSPNLSDYSNKCPTPPK